MSWLSGILDDLSSAATNHPDLMASLPVIAGAVLSARNGRIGGPLGAGLLAGGSLMALRQPKGKALSPVGWYNPKTKQIEYTQPTVGQAMGPPGPDFGLFNPPKAGPAQKMETRYQVDPASGKVISQKDVPVGSPPEQGWFSSQAANLNANILSRNATEALRKQGLAQSAQEHADTRALALQLHNDRPPREPHLQALVDSSGKVTGILNLDTGMTRPVSGPTGYKTTPKSAVGKIQRFGNAIYYTDVSADGKPIINKLADIPPSVKDRQKNEYVNFASDYLTKHPGAGGIEIDAAWEDFKNKAAAGRTTATGEARNALPTVEKPQDYLRERSKVMQQVKTELTNPKWYSKGLPAGTSVAAITNDRMAALGWNPATGKRLKPGDKVRLSNGHMATWKGAP